ncbi:DUF1801 domain-containing protein [Grimontia sp. NTOU-MAR1]|uniref:DUF1801 domain-containing protein n=1 Tax=Grimontia sp. NTOU-MAR1 TaxID=3111011 RepID=UPI002DB594ED|nr:DUF1801 domain-containing protein [Grimontia sp. NTOU-MAR1]WRW01068.1 DUF1801 domain-containing protein [Grimontia sp. NTOU-MAR1]
MKEEIKAKFESYPEPTKSRLLQLRELIFAVAAESGVSVDESLKWGEPSYSVKGGTPLRFDWKSKSPESISIFFHCQSLMIDTLKEVMPEAFNYSGNRELSFPLNQPFPDKALRVCIEAAFTYQSRRRQPLLGL